MYRQQLYSVIVAMLLVGSGCGGLATPAPDSEGPRAGEPVVETASQTLEKEESQPARPRIPVRLRRMADEIEWVPVETDSSGGGVFDLVLRMRAADDQEQDASASTQSDDSESSDGRASDGDPIPLPAAPGWQLSGKDQDGDPIPLPADRTSSRNGNASDGDPIPLPAIRLGDTENDDESDGSQTTYTYRADKTVTIVIANVELDGQ